MEKVTKVLLLLKNMIYESTGPLEAVRFAKYYHKKGLEVTIILWGPMGVLLGKEGKVGVINYEAQVKECLDMGINFLVCGLASKIIGLKESELIDGIDMVPSSRIADLLLEYQEQGQLVISL